MNMQPTSLSAGDVTPRAKRADFQTSDDKAMLRAARDLTQGLGQARPGIYWPDMLVSAALGYGAIATAILTDNLAIAVVAGLVGSLALYRALMFIHELTHIHRDALPGFRTGWNLLVGIPMLTPSFMYEGVHVIHHKRTQYGTVEDPEYLPLALMKPWSLPAFVLIALLAWILREAAERKAAKQAGPQSSEEVAARVDAMARAQRLQNPDAYEDGPWCYTTDPGTAKWQLCFPSCSYAFQQSFKSSRFPLILTDFSKLRF